MSRPPLYADFVRHMEDGTETQDIMRAADIESHWSGYTGFVGHSVPAGLVYGVIAAMIDSGLWAWGDGDRQSIVRVR